MTGIRVLIADDNLVDRKLLSRIIRNQGNTVLEAASGEEAIEAFRLHKPDIVLLDVLMPGIGGKEAAREIKAAAGEDMVPIIFLTSLTDAHDLADCLESGGDDFLNKPYNPVVLEAKVRSFYRMRDMHRTLQAQRDTIASHNDHLIREQETAKAVFDNVAHHGSLASPNIRYMLSPLAVFNGDVLLAARGPGGGMHVLLGDFTGHGLPAAIGAMPLAEIFYGMTTKGFGIRDIIREINLKLHNILPVGFFCCSTMVSLDFDNKTASLWMGGVPDVYLLRSQTRELEALCATHLPLGVLSNARFNDSVVDINFNDGDRLFCWSDGILEARNSEGDMFGQERLEAVIRNSLTAADVFDNIQHALSQFQGNCEHDDDVTLLELEMMDRAVLGEPPSNAETAPTGGPIDWSLSYRLGPQSLRSFNPLPLMMHIIMEVPALQNINGQLYSILSELYSNALEHGVLGLDSSLKQSSEGFMRYYQEREVRLQQLHDGHVTIELEHTGSGDQGSLLLRFRDSGPGFDWQAMVKRNRCASGDAHRYCGRGIPLLSSICTSLEYKETGNVVEAVIDWPINAEG